MTSERIKELQENTAYPKSRSVMLALKQVWNECEQEKSDLQKQNEALANALKWSLSKVIKPIARTNVNTEYYDKYFEIEELLDNFLNR